MLYVEIVLTLVAALLIAGSFVAAIRVRARGRGREATYHWPGIIILSLSLAVTVGVTVHIVAAPTTDVPPGVGQFRMAGPGEAE